MSTIKKFSLSTKRSVSTFTCYSDNKEVTYESKVTNRRYHKLLAATYRVLIKAGIPVSCNITSMRDLVNDLRRLGYYCTHNNYTVKGENCWDFVKIDSMVAVRHTDLDNWRIVESERVSPTKIYDRLMPLAEYLEKIGK